MPYLIGEQYKGRLDSALTVVEGIPSSAGITKIPTRFESISMAAGDDLFRIATFTGSWSVGAQKTVTLASNTSQTVNATNLFFPVPAPDSPAAKVTCAIAKDGTAWYLIDVPFEEATAVFAAGTSRVSIVPAGATTTTTVVSGVSTAPRTFLTAVAASLNTANCQISVTPTTASASVVTAVSTATVTTVSVAGTQNVVVMNGTFTATFIRIAV